MKHIKKLFLIMMFMIFTVGCSAVDVDTSNSLSKQAIQQNTMTKVQNDVNEIMGKSYDYVLKYMGNPYVSVYSIKINGFETLDDLDKIKDFEQVKIVSKGLLYPKYTSDYRLEGSAIYIVVKNDEVSKVETCDFKNFDKSQAYEDGADISISLYGKYDSVNLEGLDNEDLSKYIGKSENDISNLIKHKQSIYSIALAMNDKVKVDIYKTNDNKYLVVGLEDKKIICLEENDSLGIEHLYETIN